MLKIQTWQTWKKKNKPRISTVQDSTLGYVESIVPTLKSYGFIVEENERDFDLTPKQDALNLINEDEISDLVYSVWNHSQGYCSKIVIGYKKNC